MKRYELANGAAVNVIETDRFKSSLLSINLAVPIEAETAALNTLLFCVLKQGSANYPSQAAINTRLDDLYAAELSTRNYKRGDMQILGFAVDFLDNCYIPDGTDVLGGSADMLGELLLHPLLDESGCFRADLVAREKTMLCDAIRAQINNKRAYAQRRCIEEMCRGERFALPLTGTVEEVDAITPKMLTDRYYALLRTARVEFFFIGSTPTDVLLPRLEHAFAAYPAHSVAEVQTQVVRRAELVREITEEQDVAQGKLVMGFRSGYAVADPDYLHFMVFCELFGGSAASKLFLNVREKLSLCYYCSADMDSYKGLMFVSSGVAAENRDRAYEEIMRQLEAVRGGDFTEQDLSNAIRGLQSAYRQLGDSPGALESYSLGRMLFGVNLTAEDMVRGLGKVTADDVIAAARRVSLDTVYFMRGPACGACPDDEEDDDE